MEGSTALAAFKSRLEVALEGSSVALPDDDDELLEHDSFGALILLNAIEEISGCVQLPDAPPRIATVAEAHSYYEFLRSRLK